MDSCIQYWQEVGQWQQETDMADSMYSTKDQHMNINSLSKSKYLKTTDVPEPVLVTIKDIDVVNVARENERKDERPVVFFRELEKGMVFNQTNLKRAAKAFGSEETDDWIGKKIVVYTDEDVEFGGEIVGGLRVRAPRVQSAPAKPVTKQEPDPRYREETPMQGIRGMDSDIPF